MDDEEQNIKHLSCFVLCLNSPSEPLKRKTLNKEWLRPRDHNVHDQQP